MNTETKAMARKAAMASLVNKVRQHPKKTMTAGAIVVLILGFLEFAEPLCGLIPNAAGSSICAMVVKAAPEIARQLEEPPVTMNGEPKVAPGTTNVDRP